ncbi:hypothetical protein ACS0TY_032228 [Phlomoides rotata]
MVMYSICFQFIFLFTVINSVSLLHGHGDSGGMKFELIHRWRKAAPPLSQLERTKQMLHSDAIRLRAISQKQGNRDAIRRKTEENQNEYHPDCNTGRRRSHKYHNVSGELPIHSGADYGNGQYFVNVRFGSPAQKVVLIADTGSDLTWMNCKYRCRGRGCRSKHRVFRGDRSLSFRTLPCSSRTCKVDLASLFSLTNCPSPMDPCTYDYRYGDGSATQGLFAKETITFPLTNGRRTRVHNMLVGCSESTQGQSFKGADGVLGLGYSNFSFAVSAAYKYGGKLSYCLVDHLAPKNVSSYLILGSSQQVNISSQKMHYTELVLGVIMSFYAVNMKGISIGESMLEIPAYTWNVSGAGGVIVDSGSSLTALTLPAYRPVMDTLKLSLAQFKQLDVDIGPLEYCFNSTGFNETLVPRLVFHFDDGARFEPPVKSYVIDAATGVKCLGFVSAAWPGASVIGNIMQQNHFWEFDLVNSRLGFATSECT